MRAIQLNAYGNPAETITVVDLPEPAAPGAGEVLIRVEYAPVNPADLLLAQGWYAVRPNLPSVIGNEGVGTIIAVGPGVTNVRPGDRVAAPLSSFTWRQRMVIPASGLVALPQQAELRQLAMVGVNPVTAQLLLDGYVDLLPGDWIVQNAANSGVGRSVIAFARERGIKTVNIVRRAELVAELTTAGGDVVLVDGPDLAADIATATGNAPIRLGLDGVSGAAMATLATLLAPGAALVAYGAMGSGAPTVNPGDLIYKQLAVHGFFLGTPAHAPKFPALIAEAGALIAAGKLKLPIAAVYPLSQIQRAIAHVQAGGKVLLDIANA